MQASVFSQFGDPAQVLQVAERPQPAARRGQVLVRMLAAPVNPSDLLSIRGEYGRRPTLPAIPGFEGAGIVEAGGGLLGRLLRGKRVCALSRRGGTWAEYCSVSARQAIPVPKALPLEQAAMFFVNPATAYILTRRVLVVPTGAWLLQTAAASTVGRMIVRLGRHYGFRTLNVVRRQEQVEELQKIGADEVVAFDGNRQPADELIDTVARIAGDGLRFAVDPVGGAVGSAVAQCLGSNGRMLVYGTLADEPLSFSPRVLMTANARVEGFWLANWMAAQNVLGKLRLVRRLGSLTKRGVLAADVAEWHPLSEVAAAVQAADRPGRTGKVLLRISQT